jgi:hypothetical protein
MFGAFIFLLSLGADFIGLGQGGVQATQLLGAEIGVLLCLGGAAWLVADRNGKLRLDEMGGKVRGFFSNMTVSSWVFIGFLFTFILFFAYPMFLNPQEQYQYFYKYLPEGGRIGMDIRAIRDLVQDWVVLRQFHYNDGGVWYPPFYNVFYAPFLLLDRRASYIVITSITLLCYIFFALVIPKLITSAKSDPLIMLFFTTGIVSYGLQLELERGQSNIMVMLFCLLGIYIFHYHHEFRFFAYFLFTAAVQLKVYPVIFVLLFIRDWRDWKNNIKRMAGLGLLNFSALFILGYSVFIDFIGAIFFRSFGESMDWVGNHSIKSYISLLTHEKFSPLSFSAMAWVLDHVSLLSISLLVYFLACFLAVIGIAIWRREKGFLPHIFLVCTIMALAIPSVSHDYKLALLAAPMAIFMGNYTLPSHPYKKALSYFLILIASVGYSAMLYPFKYRPEFIANSLPLLFILLTAVTILYALAPRTNENLRL